MSNQPYGLAMDGVFNDRPQYGCFIGGRTIKPRSYKMNNTISDTAFHDQLARNARQVLRKCGLATDIVDDSDAQRMQAADTMIEQREMARAGFYAQFPDAARIKIDTSGIPVRPRAPSRSDAADSKSGASSAENFYDMFPDARRIRQL